MAPSEYISYLNQEVLLCPHRSSSARIHGSSFHGGKSAGYAGKRSNGLLNTLSFGTTDSYSFAYFITPTLRERLHIILWHYYLNCFTSFPILPANYYRIFTRCEAVNFRIDIVATQAPTRPRKNFFFIKCQYISL